MIRLQRGPVEVGGVTLRNHLILAAGVLGTSGSSLARMLREGAGAVVSKSIGPEPRSGHAGPCLVVLEDGVLNAMGLPNPSHEFKEELKPLDGKPVIVSIFGGNPEEFSEVASWFADSATAFELNVSCPHASGYGAQIGTNPDLVQACTSAVARFNKPVWVKLTPNVTDITLIGKAAEDGGADALVAINTVRAMRISLEAKRPVLGNRFGGLSGKAIFPIAIRCVYELYESCKIPVIGCGGISSADDVVEMMMAGASAVEIGSALRGNPGLFREISSVLYSDNGVFSKEIVGCAHE
ncbi:MAG TPA: dihydroorotate dehydrogenase [Methanospirillum sp.]|uniref:dihydroorotate dehydrogenase n=1 Tax=Methanospirillum sp. TaxID=45200 RepID=UPI002C50250C|nr:dihydroorotate dehydrogenase [Methanospirillum sp.]HWQ64965.1 dihydroorotate dehydrogenase [Methanospirillum sp.]